MGSPTIFLLLLSAAIGLAQLSESDQREKRGAPSTSLPRWPIPVPYSIRDEFTPEQKTSIKAGIASIESKTCVKFVEDSSTNYKLIYKLTPGNCGSTVGDKRFGYQNHEVSLSEGCAAGLGNVQHETAHALGVAHTQMRADRDKYIKVDTTNVSETFKGNFAKLSAEDSPDYGIPFEFGSRMMYPPYDYGKYGLPVITPHDEGYLSSTGTAPVMTFYDWKIINMHYNCTGKHSTICAGSKIVCENGGYLHPRDCNRCICGDFFDGQRCDIERGGIDLEEGKEEVLYANMTGYFNTLGYKDWAYYNVDPLRVIKAPANSRIRVTIESLKLRYIFEEGTLTVKCPQPHTCDRAGVEIADEDMLMAGKKYCCSEKTPISFISKNNVIGYRAFAHKSTNFQSKVTFKIEPGTVPPTTTTTNSPTTITTVTSTVTTTTQPPKVPTTTTVTTTTSPPTVPTTTTVPVDTDVCEY